MPSSPSPPHPLTLSPYQVIWGTLAALLLLGAATWMASRLAATPPAEVEIAGFATNLRDRTPSQRHNAWLATRQLDGAVIPAGATFSFNRRVRTWTLDRGYVKAPVSFDGELVRAYGGGVCQTSTTLYDAALLAGLTILERHSHVFAAHYVPPGRDAAVAQPGIDLRFRNPYTFPVRIRARAGHDILDVRILAPRRPRTHVALTSEFLSATTPARLARIASNRSGSARVWVRSPGVAGCRVVTYRVFSRNGQEVRRERLSDDTYQAMNRIVQVPED